MDVLLQGSPLHQPTSLSPGLFATARDMLGLAAQLMADDVPTFWTTVEQLRSVLLALKGPPVAQRMLFDLTAIDERLRTRRPGQPAGAYTLVYHLVAFDGQEELRLKVPLDEASLRAPSIVALWPNANWYEREVFDLFGIVFDGHPNLRRILTPPTWIGHPLRKDHHARATEMPPYSLTEEQEFAEQEALRFDPESWGMSRRSGNTEFMFLNLGPNHPSVHGVFRIVLQLEGEEIVDAVPEIGFHHRGAEKMGERQSWHSFIPYTDRVDYLGGVMNNLPYVLAMEQLAGITVPPRAQTIRVMLAEFFRIASHLVFYGTMSGRGVHRDGAVLRSGRRLWRWCGRPRGDAVRGAVDAGGEPARPAPEQHQAAARLFLHRASRLPARGVPVAAGKRHRRVELLSCRLRVTTLGAFGAVSLLSRGEERRDAASLDNYRGLFWTRPALAASLTLMLLSLAGIPPTMGFIGKAYVMAAGVGTGLTVPLAALVLSSIIGLYYYLRVVVVMASPVQAPYGSRPAPRRDLPGQAALVVLTASLVVFGLYPSTLIGAALRHGPGVRAGSVGDQTRASRATSDVARVADAQPWHEGWFT
jgi:NADH:ubiquinone oxidoreductase subunit C